MIQVCVQGTIDILSTLKSKYRCMKRRASWFREKTEGSEWVRTGVGKQETSENSEWWGKRRNTGPGKEGFLLIFWMRQEVIRGLWITEMTLYNLGLNRMTQLLWWGQIWLVIVITFDETYLYLKEMGVRSIKIQHIFYFHFLIWYWFLLWKLKQYQSRITWIFLCPSLSLKCEIIAILSVLFYRKHQVSCGFHGFWTYFEGTDKTYWWIWYRVWKEKRECKN